MCSKTSRCYSRSANDAPGTVHVESVESCTSIVDSQTARVQQVMESAMMALVI